MRVSSAMGSRIRSVRLPRAAMTRIDAEEHVLRRSRRPRRQARRRPARARSGPPEERAQRADPAAPDPARPPAAATTVTTAQREVRQPAARGEHRAERRQRIEAEEEVGVGERGMALQRREQEEDEGAQGGDLDGAAHPAGGSPAARSRAPRLLRGAGRRVTGAGTGSCSPLVTRDPGSSDVADGEGREVHGAEIHGRRRLDVRARRPAADIEEPAGLGVGGDPVLAGDRPCS